MPSTWSRGKPTLETTSPKVPRPPRERRAFSTSGRASAVVTAFTLVSSEGSWRIDGAAWWVPWRLQS